MSGNSVESEMQGERKGRMTYQVIDFHFLFSTPFRTKKYSPKEKTPINCITITIWVCEHMHLPAGTPCAGRRRSGCPSRPTEP